MKLKNVLKGYLSRDEYESIVIVDIENLHVTFCGTIESLKNPPEILQEHQKLLMNTEVIKSYDNGTRLDFFI